MNFFRAQRSIHAPRLRLRKVFGKDKVIIYEMNKYLAQHLT